MRELFAYWEARRRDGRLPARADIDPLDFPYLLGEVLLVDVLRDPLRFRVRLHGARIARRAGYDLTGRLVDELPDGEFRATAIESFSIVATRAVPLLSRQGRVIDGRVHRYETLMLPLAADGESVDMLLVGLVYRPQ